MKHVINITKYLSLYFCLLDPPVFNRVVMFDSKLTPSQLFDYFLLIFFYNILAVIHGKRTTFLTGHIFKNLELIYTVELGRFPCFESLPYIVNIAKIQRFYSWDVSDWCSDKK